MSTALYLWGLVIVFLAPSGLVWGCEVQIGIKKTWGLFLQSVLVSIGGVLV